MKQQMSGNYNHDNTITENSDKSFTSLTAHQKRNLNNNISASYLDQKQNLNTQQ